MQLRRIVEERQEELTSADRRVADVLLGDRMGGSFHTAQEVAERAGVHASTAGRLARKLGFDSYRELREHLRSSVLSDMDAAVRVQRRLDRAGGSSVLQSMVQGEIEALTALPQQVPQAAIDHATRLLREAANILVIAESHGGSLAEIFARRLVRSGYRATALTHVDWQAADALLAFGRGDLLVAMSFRHGSLALERLAAQVRGQGAALLHITDRTSRIADLADVTLQAARGQPGESHSLTVPMTICNTLILELTRTDEGRSLAQLKKLEALRRLFSEPASPGSTRRDSDHEAVTEPLDTGSDRKGR